MGEMYEILTPVGDAQVLLAENRSQSVVMLAPLKHAPEFNKSSANSQELERPTTPTKRCTSPIWHGLSTPETPDFRLVDTSSWYPELGDQCKEPNNGIACHIRRNGRDSLDVGNIEAGSLSDNTTVNVGHSQDQQYTAHRLQLQQAENDDSEATAVTEKQKQSLFDEFQREIEHARLSASGIEGESPTAVDGPRRSGRLRRKTPEDASPASIPKMTAIASHTIVEPSLSVPLLSCPESSFASQAIIHLPPDPNPAYLTLDWDLQYPSGGSTHPSYPYPQLDPRLLFNPRIVPIAQGLPDITQLPALVLPTGWRHITWSGLNPVVFDSYFQAFKLTPIGPLPLTSEELQQGALQKYVPGGECHPENGLLPDISSLGDGSVQGYFDLEGAEWILPWLKNGSFEDPPNGQFHCAIGDFVTPPAPSDTAGVSVPAAQLSKDAFDCPDNVVDIADAWRWIKEKETRPDAPFVPSQSKTWRGSGIHRTNRRIKQPIASLLAVVLPEARRSPHDALASMLANQNGRQFCKFESVATPVHVDITLLQNVEITLLELVSYFPLHYKWRKGADRMVRAGLTASEITNLINWTRQLDGKALRQKSKINGQIWYEYEATESKKRVRIVREGEEEGATYTTEGWTNSSWELTDYPLLGLSHGLVHEPQGVDAGPLTAAIKWCREHKRFDALLSDVPSMLGNAGIPSSMESIGSQDLDEEVSSRYDSVLKRDRKRVLKSICEIKRSVESNEEKEHKRRKMR